MKISVLVRSWNSSRVELGQYLAGRLLFKSCLSPVVNPYSWLELIGYLIPVLGSKFKLSYQLSKCRIHEICGLNNPWNHQRSIYKAGL